MTTMTPMFKELPANAAQDQELVNRVALVIRDDISNLDPAAVVLVHREVDLLVKTKDQPNFNSELKTSFLIVCNEPNVTPEVQVYYVRKLTTSGVYINMSSNPWFVAFVDAFGPLLRAARMTDIPQKD